MPASRPLHRSDDLGEWFDREIRPAILAELGQVRADTVTAGDAPLRAIRHWIGELHRRQRGWTPETREVVAVLAAELAALAGDQ